MVKATVRALAKLQRLPPPKERRQGQPKSAARPKVRTARTFPGLKPEKGRT